MRCRRRYRSEDWGRRMKSVSRFEANLLRLLHFFLHQAPIQQALQLLDAKLEHMLLKLGLHVSDIERQVAFDELCRIVDMKLDYRAAY